MGAGKKNNFDGLDNVFADFNNSAQIALESAEEPKPKKRTRKTAKANTGDSESVKKDPKQLVTFYMSKSIVDMLKKYCRIRGFSAGEVLTCALIPYMRDNPPTQAEKDAYLRKLEDLSDVDFEKLTSNI